MELQASLFYVEHSRTANNQRYVIEKPCLKSKSKTTKKLISITLLMELGNDLESNEQSKEPKQYLGEG